MPAIDFRKKLKHLYAPPAKGIIVVDVPSMNFLMVDGAGDPNTSPDYAAAVEALFTLSYTLKFMVKKGPAAVDYGVMPLEGLWWADDPSAFTERRKDEWKWTAMIMQPDPVTAELVAEAARQAAGKKSLPALPRVLFRPFAEGKAAQLLHVGPFSEEGPNIRRLHEFIAAQGGSLRGRHHEIYLSDIRRAAPAKWKTVIRQPFG